MASLQHGPSWPCSPSFHANPGFKFLCSVQHRHSRRDASPPISERHASSRLASSLLCQHMQTPQGEALMALTNQGLPPSLISLAASHQLELLAATSSSSGTYGVEGKEREEREAVQEILLALVSSKLQHIATLALPDLDRDATLAAISEQHTRRHHATLALRPPRLDDMLQAIHAPDVQPLTSRHVAMVINGRNHADLHPHVDVEPKAFAHVRKLELGKMYAASIMHGYFLARVNQRFTLERTLQIEVVPTEAHSQYGFNEVKSERVISMEAYIQDDATIRRMSNLSSSLTLNVIERHCEALFGNYASKDTNTDTSINIQLGFVRSLIYQALAFGALLWDMEHNFVPLFYPLSCQGD